VTSGAEGQCLGVSNTSPLEPTEIPLGVVGVVQFEGDLSQSSRRGEPPTDFGCGAGQSQDQFENLNRSREITFTPSRHAFQITLLEIAGHEVKPTFGIA
jgi:hypothetical protein